MTLSTTPFLIGQFSKWGDLVGLFFLVIKPLPFLIWFNVAFLCCDSCKTDEGFSNEVCDCRLIKLLAIASLGAMREDALVLKADAIALWMLSALNMAGFFQDRRYLQQQETTNYLFDIIPVFNFTLVWKLSPKSQNS